MVYLGVPLMLVAQLIAEMIFVGLTSEEPNSEEDREWLGRAAGLCLLAAAGMARRDAPGLTSARISPMRAGKILCTSIRRDPWSVVVLLYVIGVIAAALGRSGRTPARGPQNGS